MTRTRPALRVEPLEDRSVPATLRILPLTGGITGFGTAGTDPSSPSAQNSELVPTTDLTVPFGPRELGLVTAPVRASSVAGIGTAVPAGLFPTLGTAVPSGRLVFDLASTAVKGGGINGGGSTVYTYGLDPNVILSPLTIEVVPDPGEAVGTPVRLSFGFTASASAPNLAGQVALRQDANFAVNGGPRTSLLSRNIQSGGVAPNLAGGQDVTVAVGDRVSFEFTQLASLAGLGSGTATARMVLGLAVSSAAPGAGTVGVGAGGGPAVTVYNPDGTPKRTFFAFEPTFAGGVRVASGDVNHDGVADTVAGTGPGRTAEVRVFDGASGTELFRTQPFGDFAGGVFVAAGDVDGDGKAEVAVSPDQGGGPRVRVFRGIDFAPLVDFFGIEDPAFRGGARVAIGDLNGDGKAEVVVAAGFQGGPRVSGWDGAGLAGGTFRHPFGDFFAFEPTLRNGTFVAVGDVDGDGTGDVIAGGGPGGGPRVLVFDGGELRAGRRTPLANFFAGPEGERNGVPVGSADLDADGRADVLSGTGAGSGSRARAYLGRDLTPSTAPPAFRDFDPFPGVLGVFVG
ncbi:MAG: VCBS repeat-containing protein [Gemmataceae bacterium]|nr:VCBS repeat-containing protein [Gemmataceae bacterium]